MNVIVGIDPGVSGGATMLRGGGRVVTTVGFKPAWTQQEFNRTLRKLLRDAMRWNTGVPGFRDRMVFLELVGHIGRKDGRKGLFTFGRVDGIIRGTIMTLDLKVNEVTPMMWQSAMRCLTGGDKNVSKRRAAELWPDVKWTHATADSALIAEYGRRRITRGSLL